ncbi:SMI1/KNR4 family protein [Actinoplanes sp. NPDC051861]|uniref:SMI1/KNR4 family protein n=1 Tax=Actinoplanes sp. NPDC051861 TaxID=3155170 RepID=UPI003439D72A
MERGWAGRGPWLITATSGDVDWRVAADVIAAAAEVPVAVVVVGGDGPEREHFAALLEIGELSLEQARQLVVAMVRVYPVVLVGGSAGLLMPVGRDGWNLADLGAAVRAPAVVVTGPGPDAVNHTTLALGALAGQGISASVVTIGEVDETALPVTPAGRIPADHEDLAEAAEWLHPWLRAGAEPPPPADGSRGTVNGRKVVLALLAVFAVMVVVVCGLAMLGGPEITQQRITAPTTHKSGYVARMPTGPAPTVSVRRRASTDECPENQRGTTITRPDRATTTRVNAAWKRIEKWLAERAPTSSRALVGPASQPRIDNLQRQMSISFPPDLVASLRRHDGARSNGAFDLPPFFTPLSVDDILAEWRVTCGVQANAGDWGRDSPWWHRSFVPFAVDGGGGSIFTDQRPGGHGRVGEFYPEDGTSFERWPRSVAELLEKTAASLESGRPYEGRYRPTVDDEGRLDWEILRTE